MQSDESIIGRTVRVCGRDAVARGTVEAVAEDGSVHVRNGEKLVVADPLNVTLIEGSDDEDSDDDNSERGSVEYFAELIRESVDVLAPWHRFEHVDTVTTGVLRSVLASQESDATVREWFRNALDAGDRVRAELTRSTGTAGVA